MCFICFQPRFGQSLEREADWAAAARAQATKMEMATASVPSRSGEPRDSGNTGSANKYGAPCRSLPR
jgi:hypothetical protein